MMWADRIASEIRDTRTPRNGKTFLIRDEKTLSGRVHVGSMRGVAIHGLVSEVLSEQGVPNEYRFELNDFDDFDSVPGYLDIGVYREHLGKPLYAVPSPDPAFANYAEYFGTEFVDVHKRAGFTPNYYRAYADLYKMGKMDACIRTALTKAADVRRIYKEISGSVKKDDWLPLTVVCEQCRKIRTTRTHDFDGETVGYVCDQNPDDTTSCGHSGRIAPWGGNGKLHWKVDWAAKWVAQGVDIEGGGKDHSTKGGSRDVANHIAKEVFNYEPPFNIPYEFFLVGGKKMSSSKGRGASAKDMCDLFPPQLFRLALIGKDIREQIDIDPSGESVPRLYDWYDELAEVLRQGEGTDYTRTYMFSQLPGDQATPPIPWQMRFREVAFIVQMPHLSLRDEAARVKGSPLSEEEVAALEERARYAKFWLTTYAPEEFKYTLQETLLEVELSEEQKHALALLAEYVKMPRTGEEIHAYLHQLKTDALIAPAKLFSAIYWVFLNRDSGPKAGWFLASLPHEFVHKRLSESSQ
jgi:lysyl-tRNA synthetase class 1